MTARTRVDLSLVALLALVAVMAAVAFVVSGSTSSWRERQEQRAAEAETARTVHRAAIAARVEECRSKGGVPITDGWSGQLVRCDFPRRP